MKPAATLGETVLVTGAGGFLGSAVTRLLVETAVARRPVFADGAPIDRVVATLRPGGSRERLAGLPPDGPWAIQHVDLMHEAELRALLARARPRAVLHGALDRAVYGCLTPAELHRCLLTPLETLFMGLADVPGSLLVHTGSAWVLAAGRRLGEQASLAPLSSYAKAKAEEERHLPILHGQTGVPWISLRLFNLFGRYEQSSRLLPYVVSRLRRGEVANLSQGDQMRDFNDVDVAARAYLCALSAEASAWCRLYHIGSGVATRTRDFATIVANVIGNGHLLRFGTVQTPDARVSALVADPTLARRSLGWTPSSDLHADIERAVRWWLDRPAPISLAVGPGTSAWSLL